MGIEKHGKNGQMGLGMDGWEVERTNTSGDGKAWGK